ncbi:amidohydrolase [Aureivirga sp. CE67]|uniref:amidohydrolase n=1 Tax=Aureivirga sp. CE67 TaxID=1788983 RepID=UPI0018CBD0B2|nr:amidohydrolase [Aureivirga sp. CE67]
MRKISFLVGILAAFASCTVKEEVDVIYKNGNVYTVNDNFDKVQDFAVKDGKFIAVGGDISANYKATKVVDLKGKSVYPGFIDAHCHFYGLGLQLQKVDLVGTKSFQEVLDRIVAFQKKKNVPFITGRGWDQTKWEVKEFPTKEKLDSLFPNTPVAVRRIDGHAVLANQKALDLADITVKTKVDGGEVILKDGKPTGVLIDNAMDLVLAKVPEPTKREKIQALIDAEKICTDLGLTTVDDAGLDKEVIELIDSLQKAGTLHMKVYAMASATKENLNFYLKNGKVKTPKLNVRSFKYYADGALGSRGAALKESYSDKHNHFGTLLSSVEDFESTAKRIANSDFQMNTHAIGDSANYVVLKTYTDILGNKAKERRWRVEHAQVVSKVDLEFYKNIFPSVQPTHATSDMYWAEKRLGEERVKEAYAYKELLDAYGKIALGTDFPIERVSPFLTFYAATARKDLENFPENGFQTENALTREETLKGMTIWAAYSNFEENEKGSIEIGKSADFIILNQDIMTVEETKIPETKVEKTYIDGILLK